MTDPNDTIVTLLHTLIDRATEIAHLFDNGAARIDSGTFVRWCDSFADARQAVESKTSTL
jgi:hypothetical protein